LIHRLAAVCRAVGIVGIAQQHTLFDEELHRIVADGFAGIGRVAVAVGGRDEVDDGSDATQRSLRVAPSGIWLEVKQGEQRVGSGFVALLRAKLQCSERLNGLGEPLLPGSSFTVGFISGHEGGW
jgi:hypothetical protein